VFLRAARLRPNLTNPSSGTPKGPAGPARGPSTWISNKEQVAVASPPVASEEVGSIALWQVARGAARKKPIARSSWVGRIGAGRNMRSQVAATIALLSICNAFLRPGGPTTPQRRQRCSIRRASSADRQLQRSCARARHTALPVPTMRRLQMANDEDDNSMANPSSSASNIKFFELEDAFDDNGEDVVGTKFFGGNTMKDELYVPEEEEMATELQSVGQEADELVYSRFEDTSSFEDETSRKVCGALQAAINQILHGADANSTASTAAALWREDPKVVWDTPFSASEPTPLKQLGASKSFYSSLDIAVLSAKTIRSDEDSSTIQVRWDLGAVWPNPWESRVLITGTSQITTREDGDGTLVLLKQVDILDGRDSSDIVGALSSQLMPRFWDIYHIGMSPSAETDPRFDVPLEKGKLSNASGGKKGLFSNYELSYLPPRLMTEASLIDDNGRAGRTAQALPNHSFTTAIKTMGKRDYFVPVSPIEVTISKMQDGEGSEVKWSVPVPPYFASRATLPLPAYDESEHANEQSETNSGLAITKDNEVAKSSTRKLSAPPPKPPRSLECRYSVRPSRLVATIPFAGNPQDEEVAQLRRKLYDQVVERDGFKPKLDPITNRPQFFFWMNDAKACFFERRFGHGGIRVASRLEQIQFCRY
ncbi:hypothetical protein THAOC_28739, partial [Thalassiosira oceanica]